MDCFLLHLDTLDVAFGHIQCWSGSEQLVLNLLGKVLNSQIESPAKGRFEKAKQQRAHHRSGADL
jgi:hypothetical protein